MDTMGSGHLIQSLFHVSQLEFHGWPSSRWDYSRLRSGFEEPKWAHVDAAWGPVGNGS